MAEVEIDFIGSDGGLESQVDTLDSKLNALDMERAEANIKQSLASIETRMERMGTTAKTVLLSIGGAFSIGQVVQLGKEIVQIAGESEQFADRITVLGNNFRNVLLVVAGGVIPAIEKVVDVGVVGFTALQTTVKNFGLAFEIAWQTAALAAVQFTNVTSHFFQEQLPGWMSWLNSNWGNLWTDMLNLTSTVVANMWTNLSDFFTNVWSWLSGGEADFKWVGLTEGFESTLTELPKIAERKKGEIEKSLELKLGANMAEFGKAFDDQLKKNKSALSVDPAAVKKAGEENTEKMKDFGKSLMDNIKGFGEKLGEGTEIINTASNAVAAGVGALAKTDKKDEEDLTGSTEGLTDLFARIQGAAAKTPEEKDTAEIKVNTKEQVTVTKKVESAVNNVGTLISEGFAALAKGIPATVSSG